MLSREEFFREWSVDEIYEMVIEGSDTDMIAAQPLPLTDLFHDGLSPWEKCAEMAAKHPDRAVFWGSVNPLEGKKALDLMTRQVEDHGAKAFKFYNVRYDYGQPFPWRMDDPRIAYPAFERAQELGVNLIGVHKGVPLGPQPIEHTRTFDMDGAAANFPDINFVIFHVGLPWLDEVLWQIVRYPNLYASIAATVNFISRQPRVFAETLGKMLWWCGEDKIIYGGESPIWHPQWALEEFWNFELPRDIVEERGYPQLTEQAKRKILGENLARLHGIDVEAKKAELGVPADRVRRVPLPRRRVACGMRAAFIRSFDADDPGLRRGGRRPSRAVAARRLGRRRRPRGRAEPSRRLVGARHRPRGGAAADDPRLRRRGRRPGRARGGRPRRRQRSRVGRARGARSEARAAVGGPAGRAGRAGGGARRQPRPQAAGAELRGGRVPADGVADRVPDAVHEGELRPGDTVLVQGASGGLANALIRLGVAAGLRVWVTGRDAEKRAFAERLGAHADVRARRAAARARRRGDGLGRRADVQALDPGAAARRRARQLRRDRRLRRRGRARPGLPAQPAHRRLDDGHTRGARPAGPVLRRARPAPGDRRRARARRRAGGGGADGVRRPPRQARAGALAAAHASGAGTDSVTLPSATRRASSLREPMSSLR